MKKNRVYPVAIFAAAFFCANIFAGQETVESVKSEVKGLKVNATYLSEVCLVPNRPSVMIVFENTSTKDIEIDLNSLYRPFDDFVITNIKSGEQEYNSSSGPPNPVDFGKMTLSPGGFVKVLVTMPANIIYTDSQEGEYSLHHRKYGKLVKVFKISKK